MTNRRSLAILGALSLALAAPAYAKAADVASSASPVVALAETAAQLSPGKFVWADDAALGPVHLVISIPDQKLYVYRGQSMVAATAVSTGRAGNETPVGTFTILQKKETHFSNLYDAAPMPFMQRLTWDGVAIHAGRNPGFPDSHGCIRVPTAFAKKLFAATDMGAQVTVTDESIGSDYQPAPWVPDAELTAQANAEALAAAEPARRR